MSLFYSRESKQQLLGYADAEYLSDPYKEILAIHEASRECVWLRSMIQIFKKHVDYLPSEAMQPSYMKIMLLALHKLKEDS